MTDDRLAAALEQARSWVGRSETATGIATASQADILAATFDRDEPPLQPGDPVPPGAHWYYFPEVVRLAETGPDGHAARGGFMPPMPLPRRMWAADRMTFERPIHVGDALRRVSTITSVEPKEGRTGPLCFVVVRHEVFANDALATVEEHTTVYRGLSPAGSAPEPPTAPEGAVWRREIDPTPVLLFRYSALTMNSHRIHYDRDYVTGVEGYPGLLVHGPLTAALLIDLFRREMPRATLESFAVRAVSPLYDGTAFAVEGAPNSDGSSARLWAVSPTGALAQSAEITYRA